MSFARPYKLEVIVGRYDMRLQSSIGQAARVFYETSGSPANQALQENEVLRHAQAFCHPGLFVVVRPDYLDSEGRLFEWRSFDGAALRVVTF
jgi:hypothetical protein